MTEEQLQDYLDGRLPAERREELEARLREDSALRARVDEALEVRAALREDPDELSPAFYTRARARFERTQAGRRTGGIRWLSWETAGLAAAAVLAVAVFLPGLLRDGVPVDQEAASVPEAPRQEAIADAKDDAAARSQPTDGFADEPAPSMAADKEFGAEEGNEVAQLRDARLPASDTAVEAEPGPIGADNPSRQLAENKALDAIGYVGDDDGVQSKDEAQKSSPAGRSGEERAVATERLEEPIRSPDDAAGLQASESSPVRAKRATEELGRREAGKTEARSMPGEATGLKKNVPQPAPRPPAPAAAPQKSRAGAGEAAGTLTETDAVAPSGPVAGERLRQDRDQEEEAEGMLQQQANVPVSARPRVVELREGDIAPGKIRIVDDAGAALLLTEESSRRFAPDPDATPAGRVLLIGRRDTMRCELVRVEQVGEIYRVHIARSGGRAASPGGCAITLPAGARVEVIDTATGERLYE